MKPNPVKVNLPRAVRREIERRAKEMGIRFESALLYFIFKGLGAKE